MSRTLKELTTLAAAGLRRHFEAWENPEVFVQTGSGLATDGLLDETLGEIPLDELPGMPDRPSPAGHSLKLKLGRCGSRQVLVAEGRRHLYEGYGAHPCVLPVCAAAAAGIRRVVLLCAAGSVNPEFRPGMLIALTDYINNLGASPLAGPEPLGDSYFQAMSEAFSQQLISDFINSSAGSGLLIRLGVYQANLGPQYETPSETHAAVRNGADLVGMSTVLETIAANALGARVLGLALVTNFAASNSHRIPAHAEVTQVGRDAAPGIMRALNRYLA